MESIKLISLDLDGTLLNSERKIPERNRKAVQHAEEKGIEIIISTGSPYDLMPHEELKGLGISYAITANGSAVYEYPNRNCIYEESIDTITVVPILEFLMTKDMHIDLFMRGKGYCPGYTRPIVDKLDVPDARKQYILNNRVWLENPIAYIKEYALTVQKITMNFYPDQYGTLINRTEVKRYLEALCDINLVSGGWGNLEITKKGVNKGKALKILCEKLCISLNETVAFGDSLNDLDIIQAAGLSVAMKNAMTEITDVADYVTDTNDACGVAAFIERLLDIKSRY
ncbi:MAG: Cof-type HAD-IIB family hydrolase [Lachnospiraceae bacterium]|nr:Cof-type HAD-IIB family hydrolase [Lachnospiraceae bacterium]